MKYLLASTIICAAAACLCSCHRQPNLVPRLILEGEPVGLDFYLAAPYIAVVKISSENIVGDPRAAFESGPKELLLVRYDAAVENAIRGKFSTPNVSFYFFINLGQKHSYQLAPGNRYIVSLRTEGGVFRSWSDATQLKIDVYTGSHMQQDLPLSLGPEATIAYIQLTPGAGAEMRLFETGDLPGILPGMLNAWKQTRPAPKYTYERLRLLQENADPGIRGTACMVAGILFPHIPRCYTEDNPDPTLRRRIHDQLEVKRANDDPQQPLSGLLPDPWNSYLHEVLEIYTDDARPPVRAAACAELKKLAPERKVATCP
jgi:hypothetical protein